MTIYPTRGLKPSDTPSRNRGHHNERVRRIGLLETDRAGARLRLFTGLLGGGDDGMGEQDTSIFWRLRGSDSVAAHGLWMATCPSAA